MIRARKLWTIITIAFVAMMGYGSYRWMNSNGIYTKFDVPTGAHVDENWLAVARQFEKEKGAVAKIFEEATKVESFRVTLLEDASGADILKVKAINKQVSGVLVTSIGPVLKPEFAKSLGQLLLNPRSYLSPGNDAKSCLMAPGVAFRVWSGQEFADVIVCLSCNQVLVVEQDPKVPLREIGGYTARFRVGGDFDPIYSQMVSLCKQIFEKDREIQALQSRLHSDEL